MRPHMLDSRRGAGLSDEAPPHALTTAVNVSFTLI